MVSEFSFIMDLFYTNQNFIQLANRVSSVSLMERQKVDGPFVHTCIFFFLPQKTRMLMRKKEKKKNIIHKILVLPSVEDFFFLMHYLNFLIFKYYVLKIISMNGTDCLFFFFYEEKRLSKRCHLKDDFSPCVFFYLFIIILSLCVWMLDEFVC